MLLLLLLPLLPAARGLAADGCVVRDTFVALNFAEASLLRAFLGGQAGRCAEEAPYFQEGECLELQTEATPHELYLTNIGMWGDTSIDLRVTNTSAYEARNRAAHGAPPYRAPCHLPLSMLHGWHRRATRTSTGSSAAPKASLGSSTCGGLRATRTRRTWG